jgi:hypothetical protein
MHIFITILNIALLSEYLVLGVNVPKFATLQDQKNLYDQMLDGYRKTLRPILDQDQPVIVNISFNFFNVHNYDEVSGLFAFTGGLFLYWRDESIHWDPENYGNATTTRLPAEKIWIPNIGVQNPAESEEFMEIELAGFTVEITNKGLVQMSNSGMIKIMCEPDVTYYPFDVHHCALTLNVLNYKGHEVQLRLTKPAEAGKTFKQNGQWNISILNTHMGDLKMDIKMRLTRRSSFLVVNIFLPVVFLLSINVAVFLLPVDSGERISFSITSFLSFAVFITILTEKVPHQSNPLSIISAIFAFQLANSTVILICNVLVVNIYHKSTEVVSSCAASFVRFMGQTSRRKMVSPVISIKVTSKEEHRNSFDDEMDEKVTWKEVAGAFDKLFLIAFLCSTLIPVLVFIIYVMSQTKEA